MKKLAAALLFIMVVFNSQSQEKNYLKFGLDVQDHQVPKGLKKGTKAPNFSAVDQYGNKLNLEQILNEKPVVMFFYRGYWCPYCNQYLKKYADSLSLVEKKGARIIAVTPETSEKIDKTMDKTGVSFSILSDRNDEIMKKYKVEFHVTEEYQNKIQKGLNANIKQTNKQEEAMLPVPATYIIGQNGKIVARQFDVDYSNRASVQWILENLP